MNKLSTRSHRALHLERLERRLPLSASLPSLAFGPSELGRAEKVVAVGSPFGFGFAADSPADHVDPNTTDSEFAGVGSLRLDGALCTGTAISPRHVLTAGHCVDSNDDGRPDVNSVTFILNFGGDITHQIPGAQVDVHPDYTGFNNPSINDDIAVITLSETLPAGVPSYQLHRTPLTGGERFTMVGYGRSGDGLWGGLFGYYVGASTTVKRTGQNIIDVFIGQDDAGRPAGGEVYESDFDSPFVRIPVPLPSPTLRANLGGGTLGNRIETMLGPGDSGGPGFIESEGVLKVATVNTFTRQVTPQQAPAFGNQFGGMAVPSYLDFIDGVLNGSSTTTWALNPAGRAVQPGGFVAEKAVQHVPGFDFTVESWAWRSASIDSSLFEEETHHNEPAPSAAADPRLVDAVFEDSFHMHTAAAALLTSENSAEREFIVAASAKGASEELDQFLLDASWQ